MQHDPCYKETENKSKEETTKNESIPGYKTQSKNYKAEGVHVRKPTHVMKGTSKFSEPMQIIRRRGKYSNKLSKGRTWDVSHLAPLQKDFWSVEQPCSLPKGTSTLHPLEGAMGTPSA